MRAALYARVSTERQERQQTIDSQLSALRNWARTQDHALAEMHVFRDEGYSGSRLDRPGLDGLRDAVRDAAVDVVAVFSPDRLARKYLGSERFEWIMPGEQRVAVIVRPVKVRHIVGVERFRPGGPVPAS